MTQIDFYFNAADLFDVTRRLIAKACKANPKAKMVVAGDMSALQAFDQYLWAYDATSFVPHVFASSALAASTAVVLSTADEGLNGDVPHSHYGLLIHLGRTVPERFSRYERVIELVASDEASVLKGRERYKWYKQRGYPMSHLDLAKR